MDRNWIKALRRVLLVCLALMLSTAALADGVRSAVITENTYVFKNPTLSSAHLKVGKGTTVDLVATKGQWAMVKKNGVVAFMSKAQLKILSSNTTSAATVKKTPAILMETVKVYKTPSKKAASITVGIGTQVNLIAVSGNWAMIERGGVTAFTPSSNVATIAKLRPGSVSILLAHPATVYSGPSTSSEHVVVPAGTEVTVLAILRNVAIVENGGNYGYMAASSLS